MILEAIVFWFYIKKKENYFQKKNDFPIYLKNNYDDVMRRISHVTGPYKYKR